MTKTQPIFFLVIGAGRSGTTLLQSMLNAHPEIAMPPESHFLKNYVIPELNGGIWVDHAGRIYEQLIRDKYLARLNIDFQAIVESLNRRDKKISYADLYPEILNAYGRHVDKKIVGDKDPSYTYYLRDIHKYYPHCVVIHIIRDPRDVVLSRIKSDWGRENVFWYHVMEYRRAVQCSTKYGPLLYGSNYLEVFYEKLIQKPRKELDPICHKLGVSFHANMLKYYRSAGEIVCGDEMQWKGNVFKPIAENNSQKWKDGMKRWQVFTVEGACYDLMRKYGYPLSLEGCFVQKKLLAIPIFLCQLGNAAWRLIKKMCTVRE